MTSLSPLEKRVHHQKMDIFVKRINGSVMPASFIRKAILMNVAYGVKVDDAYFYFDYPYTQTADALNNALKNNKALEGIDNRIHSAFFNYRKKGNGFVAYSYKYDQKLNTFFLKRPFTNLSIPEEDLKTYLPIIHSAITNEANFLDPVSFCDELDESINILVLCRWPHEFYHKDEDNEERQYQPDRDNILVTTFKLESDFAIDQQIVDQLHDEVLYFVDSYFNSPVMEKIMAERRKSEVLAYQHSIDNLELDAGIDMIEDMVNGVEIYNQQNKLINFRTNLRILRLMHYQLFQMEYLQSGEPGINSTERLFPFLSKNISGIISILTSEYNRYRIQYQIEIIGEITQADRIPEQGNAHNRNPELYDFILVIWNLLQNAAVVSLGQEASTVFIRLSAVEGKLRISLTNQGKIKKEFFDFINDVNAEYPTRVSNPNKKYRGLEIVKDKCKSFNRSWALEAEVSKDHDNLWYTTVSITL